MFSNFRHYAHVSAQILRKRKGRPYNWLRLLTAYYTLIIKSFFQHRIRKPLPKDRRVTNVFGYDIAYSSLPVLIGLFEEIFIEGVYYFESNAAHPEILDCGSNIGMSVIYFKMLYPNGVITAFEPDTASLSLLEMNVLSNQLENVIVIDEALGRKKSERFLYTPRAGDASLNQTLLPTNDTISSKKVKVNCLSSFITSPVDLVKLDIEGAELEVLADLIETKTIDLVKCMVIEVHHKQADISPGEVVQMIERAGFTVMERKASLNESLLLCMKK